MCLGRSGGCTLDSYGSIDGQKDNSVGSIILSMLDCLPKDDNKLMSFNSQLTLRSENQKASVTPLKHLSLLVDPRLIIT